MKKFFFACLLAGLIAPLAAQNAPDNKKIVKITSEADLKNYEKSLQSKPKSQDLEKDKKATPILETEYSEEELQKILEWYGQYAEENPTAFRSKNQTKPPKTEKK